jgi:biopolymer transport protein ExbD/biopolymer transport protein TolR
MNVVPLIDILLVLLIIFMVINPTTPMGLNALVPQPAPPNQQQNQQQLDKVIVVQILANDKIKINDEDSSWAGLEPRLETIFKDRAEKVAFVKGDNDVLFAEVARAMGLMRQAGIDSVGFLTPQMEKGQ